MTIATILFWVSLAILFYCYLGYGILISIINAIKSLFVRRKKYSAEKFPVSLIISAFNEYAILSEKIKNSLALEYPPGLLKIIIVTDGSNDGSQQLIEQYPEILLLDQTERKGKYAAIKRAIKLVSTPIVVFSDANSMLNKESISNLVSHYADPEVGGVAGEKKIAKLDHISAVGEAEGLYWKYESVMKRLDSRFYTVVGAAGELFSIRTELFKDETDDVILDDFVVSMNICSLGYRIEYEPEAYAIEMPSLSLAEEEKRKVRISAGAYQSIGLLISCLNFFKQPMLSFQYFSRRLLRWIFCPLMLLILLISNFIISQKDIAINMYDWLVYLQGVFYLLAIIGWYLVHRGKKIGLLTIPFYFLFMNYCLFKGFFRYLRGNQKPTWEKSLRMNEQTISSDGFKTHR